MLHMPTTGLDLDRLAAALRAVRDTHEEQPHRPNKIALGGKCLKVLIAQLAEGGLQQEDLQPLIDLESEIRHRLTHGQNLGETNRRRGAHPSDALLARVAAVIDLLVKAGYDEAEAAQLLMRKLIVAGVSAPRAGGDARGWRRLLEWRASVSQGFGSDEAQAEYKHFTKLLEAIPANERVKRVLDGQLWDRRRKPRDA